MIPPFITIKSIESSSTYYEVRPSSVKREFLDNTYKAHGYHCQPMTTANMHGWEFILPQDVELIWDGISDTSSDHVKILTGQFLPNGSALVDTATANGTITFNLNAVIETDKDHYCLLMGPPNHFVEGAAPMSALIRSDWYQHTPLQFCWKLTVANTKIVFKAGTPFLFLINYPKNLLEQTQLKIRQINNEEGFAIEEYAKARAEFYENHESFRWAHQYKTGTGKYRPLPSNPIIE